MAVASGWVGSSAKAETGEAMMSAAATKLRITARPFMMSAMVGQSVEISQALTVGANTAYANTALTAAANALANRAITNLTITVTGVVISNATGNPCFLFANAAPWSEFKSIHLVINSGCRVSGRGGNGASLTMTGGTFKSFIEATAGGPGITNNIGTKLRITNNGVISGGGGGGGGAAFQNNDDSDNGAAGGGGCPLGAAGVRGATNNGGVSGAAGTATGAGAGASDSGSSNTSKAGNGGAWGTAGGAGSSIGGSGNKKTSGGGAAGAALNGTAPTWTTVGTINGSRL
ncbi:receptor-recognizing protein [Kluyvera cryocrescens]|uniref:receptor-recognizing protein n=1 Tax=Kluyvera cryocrescens TaxID=580 RepID=UPI002DB66FCC|nr:receptor-recognizing protein [Kluyvera cryocrescens]MEB7712336.1 receptor-recognizing protein [Kluyvera cryocrescens]